mmetsp:Transcript_67082/g.218383  ORF Transcript_67082/g.218383 Transcript_67082/m.218383 type:complete len:300 (+) Transcript_67082:1276-2175(+)
MTFSSALWRLSFSMSTSSSLLSSKRSCSRCCSTNTRRRRRSRSFRAMLPARLDSLIFCRNSPASCSSSSPFGMRACKASTSSRALAAGVVALSSRSACRSEASLLSLSESRCGSTTTARRFSLGFVSPKFVSPASNASTPSRTSAEVEALMELTLLSCCWFTRCAKLTSKASRSALFSMFAPQCSMWLRVHSSLATRFCLMRSLVPNLWISRCSAICPCSRLSMWKANASCLCISDSYLASTFFSRSCFAFGQVARKRCSKKRRSCLSKWSLGTRMPLVTSPPKPAPFPTTVPPPLRLA